jgi:hypothetical protein
LFLKRLAPLSAKSPLIQEEVEYANRGHAQKEQDMTYASVCAIESEHRQRESNKKDCDGRDELDQDEGFAQHPTFGAQNDALAGVAREV